MLISSILTSKEREYEPHEKVVGKASELPRLIIKAIMQPLERHTDFKGIQAKIGDFVGTSTDLYSLINAAYAKSIAMNYYDERIADIRIIANALYIVLGGTEHILFSAALKPHFALTVAQIAISVAEIIAIAVVSMEKLCDAVTCTTEDKMNLFFRLLLKNRPQDSIIEKLEIYGAYENFIKENHEILKNNANIDAYITGLPNIIDLPKLGLEYIKCSEAGYPKGIGRANFQCDKYPNYVSQGFSLFPKNECKITEYHHLSFDFTQTSKAKILSLQESNKFSPRNYKLFKGYIACAPNADEYLKEEKSPIPAVTNIPFWYNSDHDDVNIRDSIEQCSNMTFPNGTGKHVYSVPNDEAAYPIHNSCKNSIALIKREIHNKSNATALYQGLDEVIAGNDINHILVKNNGYYIGGNKSDIFYLKSGTDFQLIDGADGNEDIIVTDGNLSDFTINKVHNVEALYGTNASQIANISKPFRYIDLKGGKDTIILKNSTPGSTVVLHGRDIVIVGSEHDMFFEIPQESGDIRINIDSRGAIYSYNFMYHFTQIQNIKYNNIDNNLTFEFNNKDFTAKNIIIYNNHHNTIGRSQFMLIGYLDGDCTHEIIPTIKHNKDIIEQTINDARINVICSSNPHNEDMFISYLKQLGTRKLKVNIAAETPSKKYLLTRIMD